MKLVNSFEIGFSYDVFLSGLRLQILQGQNVQDFVALIHRLC